ncbi:phage tail tape measure protein [Deinococcus kurensis]|uniref:phage tail tape measure protein n=1 Tax=Deinococcus kurensis TaxID=2662757 RepID=UPI0012D2F092|nr:phage tail tape measure protein [Deinococcus kurensis]
MTNPTSLGNLVVSPAIDDSRFWADFDRLKQQVEREGVKLHVDDRAALSATDRVKKDLEALGSLTGKQAGEQARAAKVLGAQYQASARALQEQNAAVVAGYRSQTAASRAEVAAAQERAARIREQQAQMRLTSQLAAQARREEEQRYAASINALNNEQRAYRNLWQSRQLSDDQVIEAQRRIHTQALLQAQAVDKQSDAYRRLTQVAAAAQRTMDSAQGINTPGGFSSGVQQGIFSALGNLGPFGQLAEQLAGIYQQYRAAQADMKDAGQDVGRAAGEGVTEGLKSRQDEVKKAGEATGDAVEKGMKDALDIRSPSRVLRQVGIWGADGFIDGLKARYGEALQAGRGLATQVQRGAQSINLGSSFGITGGSGLGLFSGVGSTAGNSGSGVAQAAADTKDAVDALNDLPAAAKQAELGAAGVEIAAEGMGGAVETAAGHVEALREAHQQADPAARATALSEARNAIAFSVTTAAVGALAYAMVTGAQKAAEYEQGLAEISLLTDKLPSQLGDVGLGILKVGSDVHKSFGELKEAYEEILGASVKGTEDDSAALSFLARSANLAKATREETKVAADALTSLLNAYSQDATQAGRASDLLWASISAGKVKLGEIASSLGATAGQAAALNVPMDELLGAMALLTTRGIPASTALEYIRSALANVQKPSKEARDLAKSLGIEFSATSLKSMGLVKFLDQLGRGVGDNSEALATLIGDVGGLQAVLGLLNGGLSDTDGILSKVRNSTGELDRQVAKLKGTAEDSVNNFNAAWERTQILFSRGLLNSFTTFLDKGINPVLKAIGDVRTELEGLQDAKDIRAVLTIDWSKDDATTMAYKVFLSAGRTMGTATKPGEGVVGNVLNTVLYGPLGKLLQVGPAAARGVAATYTSMERRQTAIDLREQLISAGLLERGDFTKQVAEIMGNLDRYVDQMRVYFDKQREVLTGVPANKGSPAALAGQGPLLPGQTRTTDVTGMAIVAGTGMAGRTRGAPYNQTYGPNGSWGRHVGEDFFAPVGTNVYAPFAGYASLRQDKAQGNIVDLFDAAGKRLSMIHLEKYADGLAQAVAKAGGKLLVKQGELLATVGQTGTAAHAELGAKNSHLHLHATNAAGQIVDPFGQTYQGVNAGTPWAAPAGGSKAAAAEKSFEAYVKEAQRLTDAVAKYAPGGTAPNADRWRAATAQLDKFRDSNDLAAQAVQWVGLETGKSKKAVSEYGQTFDKLKGQLDITASLDNLGRPAADITSRLDTIRQQALAGAEAEKKRWGETAKYKALLDLAGDAAKKLEQVRNRKADLTPLQREQQQQQDAVAQQRMEAFLRASSAKRLQQLVDGGVTSEVSLAKWQAAQAEIKRRQDAQDKDNKKRDEDRKVAGQNRLTAERALADGQFELADRTAGLVIKTYDRQVKGAGESAVARLDIEERLGADVLASRETQARVAAQQEKTRLERERNTAVNATGLTLAQRQKLWNQYGDKIRQVDADLAETLVGIQDDATRQMADLQQRAFSEENVGKAEAYADRLRATIASLPGQDEEGLITVYGEARAARDQELLAAVYDEWERRRQQAEEEARVIAQIQSESNLSAAQAGVATAEQMISEGDTEGALQFLSDLGDSFQAMSDQGEDAVDAINFVIDAVNRLAGAFAVSDEFNTFVAGLSGTIDEQIGQVVDRLEAVTDPAMRAKLQGLLKDLRADMPKYVDPYTAGYVPGTNGFVSTGDTPVPDLEEVASARDLGTLLNETTDPAQVQALMGEVVDLLASEIGQRLPDSIRTGLEESVKGAQGYLDALAQITEDGVVDGWERAAKGALANPLPTNRFSDFSTQIFALGADGLSDPTQYDALTSSLQQARAASQLTEADLQNLLALIEELRNPKTPEIGKAFDFGQWQTDIQTLTDDFDAGRMTADEYSSGLRDAAVQLNDLADQAERMGNLKLAGQFRELAGSLRAMTPEIAAMIQGLGRIQEYAGYVQDIAGAFSGLAEAVGDEDLAANLAGLGNLAGKVAALAGDVMRILANPADIGAWVGAITKVISGIAEAINGYRKAYAQAKQMQDDFNKRFTLIDGNDFAKTTVRSRGWLADTFGGGPEVKQVVDEFGLKIAQAIEGGVMGGIKNGMKQALTTGDWTNFSNTFRESAYSGVVDGLIEAIFNDALKDILAPGIKALTDAAKTPGTEDDAAAIAAFEAGIMAAEQFLTTAGQAVQPSLDRLRNDLGITTPGNTGGVDTTGLSTMPEPVQFALATPLLEGVRGIKEAADMQKDAAATSKAAAELILATFKDGVKVTVQQGTGSYTSTTGALV